MTEQLNHQWCFEECAFLVADGRLLLPDNLELFRAECFGDFIILDGCLPRLPRLVLCNFLLDFLGVCFECFECFKLLWLLLFLFDKPRPRNIIHLLASSIQQMSAKKRTTRRKMTRSTMPAIIRKSPNPDKLLLLDSGPGL